jgi:serine/threonine protein kinase
MNYLNKTRNENKMKFFADFIVQCLTLLRKEHIIYKDLHYANIVLMYLYISLIDFHISMEYKNKNQNLENHHFLGARRLCPPEMEKGFVYDFNSDYYRLGSMLYFLLFNKYPNDVKKKKNISDITINFNETKNYSYSFIDFINKLIVNDFHK